MIGGVLQNPDQGKVGDIQTRQHKRAVFTYLITSKNEEVDKTRVGRIVNTYGFRQSVDSTNKEEVKEFVDSLMNSYDTFMAEVRKGKKPPKIISKHSVVSLSEKETEGLYKELEEKYPEASKAQIANKALDFIENLAHEYLKDHMTVPEKNIEGMNRQYFIVIHLDKDHLHAHIVANTVDYANKVFSKPREYLRTQSWCKQVSQRYDWMERLNYKDYKELTEEETKELEYSVNKERAEKRNEVVEKFKNSGLDHKKVILDINGTMRELIKRCDKIKADDLIRIFANKNEFTEYKIQPICHIKSSKVTGFSFKIHYKGQEITIKSSLLPPDIQFKSWKQKLEEYRYNTQGFDALNSYHDFLNSIMIEEKVVLSNKQYTDKIFEQAATPFKQYRSRFLKYNPDTQEFKFKNGWGSLKDKTVITIKNPKRIEIDVSNKITIFEAARTAKKMGWDIVYIDTSSEELAQIHAQALEAAGMKYQFNNPEYDKRFNKQNRPALKYKSVKKKED